jgi:5'(3')-deoxyribonucleotidase
MHLKEDFMKRIAIDMDEVIADFTSKHVKIFNSLYSDKIVLEDLRGKKLRELRPHLVEEILEILREPSFFRDLKPLQNSQAVIKELSKTYEIYITTAAMEFPTSFTAKYEWLKEHFGFLNEMNFVFCGDKSIIQADYLIDDNVRHFKRFVGQGLLFTAPHNINETGYTRLNHWLEVRDYFASKAI